ncbi:DUF2268 domain-containing protein [Thalassotalea sp. M1531]|uniref:DUF2268 domain-containing protein n=1 Tax=Thalassotalea algicola TaxID=2716224 RepID=A0A7Y0L9W7_9GAMM|nr:DUF2268 domain-containing putative Zn-dependent protease [Thalassotalea algicola]NMP30658.1 DUF2268 domain-containing protein [Thalassotalea algicola]
MKQIISNKLVFVLLIYISSSLQAHAVTNYQTSAAEAFLKSFSQNDALSLEEANHYLANNSYGLKALSARINGAKNLTLAIDNNTQDYRHAIDICLPVAMQLEDDANEIISKSLSFLLESGNVSVDIVFGANNTAATATPDGIILALESVCKGVSSAKEAESILLEYIAHEIIHVFQYRNSKRTSLNFTLLEISLIEGAADYFSEIVMERSGELQKERETYGAKHEKMIWSEFSKVMYENEYFPWLYSKPKSNMPPDMGYWIGKRIIKKLYEQTPSKKQVIKDILVLKDAKRILNRSLYQNQISPLRYFQIFS